ncbi:MULTISPECIES: TonB-dependent receptor [Methylobacterium]|uniref:Metal-pseudopaline receptor CntO n=1 Tax=Methylobacterium thuringiense TaxID=1003091 RepID=A0ABQ4TL80_9HYPH|nr:MULTISPECIES: TonB-dependent siderophore receptor [Methylobacterium]TXN21338.1 TonB-dependent siderophore receptor [Methylobacterium sp. WL9]GJE55317.1 Metal-pseudopaline receptor CntO [Methylobacterium thuringiense]
MTTHRIRTSVSLTALALALGHGPAAAQEATQEALARRTTLEEISVAGARLVGTGLSPDVAWDPKDVSLTRASPVGLNLKTPDRGASRLGLTPLETPASIDVISGETARTRGQNTVTEAVTENATGITTVAAPGNGNGAFTSRGFAGPNSIQQLYDGTRLFVGAGTVTFPFDTWNIERIEVLRGPASVLYGDGAIGGIVNVVTKKPLFTQFDVVRIGGGSYGTARLALDSTGPIGDAVAYRLNVSGNRSSGWMTPEGEFQNLAVSGALTLQATPDLSFTLSHDLGYQEPARYWGSPVIGNRVPDSLRFRNYNVRDAKITWADNWTQLKTEWTPSADITIRNTSYRLQSRRHWLDVEQYSFNRNTGLVDRGDYLEIYHSQEQVGNRFDAAFKGDLFGFRNEFVAGFDVNHIDFKHTNNFYFDKTDSVPVFGGNLGLFPQDGRAIPAYATATNQASVFAENRLILSEQFALLSGVRYDASQLDRENLQTGGRFGKSFGGLGYRFGGIYNPTPDIALYAQYATATDPVGSLISLSQSLAGFDLSTGRQVEVGIKGLSFGGSLEWTLAGYRIVKNNLISQLPGTSTVSVQVGQQSSQGVEAAVSILFPEGWRVDANVALLHAQYDDFNQVVNGATVSFAGRQPIDVPEQVSNLWLNWAFAPRWEARLGVQYVGETFNDFGNTAPRPAYALLNAGLDYQVTATSRLSLRGYNLTDEIFAISGNAVNGVNTNWLLGRPRTFEVAYTVAW